MSSIYPVDSIKNVAESIGVVNLREDVARALALDLEYRLNDLVETAAKYMRHAKRNRLTVDDLNKALRLRNLEPLFGYNTSSSSKPTLFKRTTANWQDLYYIEDEEVDFDRVIHASLPKAPLDTKFTAHWLAIEGVQPAIPQNPAHAPDSTNNGHDQQKAIKPPALFKRAQPVGGSANGSASMMESSVGRKVETTLSTELRLFYDKVTHAVLSQDERIRNASLASLRIDPGLDKLLPYLIQFLAGGVVENLRSGEPDAFTIEHCLFGLDALLSNENILIEPYLHHILPAILSVIVTSLNISSSKDKDISLRRLGASLLSKLISLFAGASAPSSLRPRICRVLLRSLLESQAEASSESPSTIDRSKIGAIWGIEAMGCQTIRITFLPHLSALSKTWQSLDSEDRDYLSDAMLAAIGKIIAEEQGALEVSEYSAMTEQELYDQLAQDLCQELRQGLVEKHGKLGLIAALVR